jgi:hypothetical protein
MDILVNLSAYLLTMAELFGYCLSMLWGTRKKRFTINNFSCTCGSSTFEVFTKDAIFTQRKEEYAEIMCSRCFSKYKSGGINEAGEVIMYRQGALSDKWERMNDRRMLN